MIKRDDFSESTRRALRDRVGGFCSRPGCGRSTVSPNEHSIDEANVTGRAAHITAARPGGARFDASLRPDERKGASNGIWLCADCADLVDKKDGIGFSVELLRSWKQGAEERQLAAALLPSQLRRPTWLDKLSTPDYANVPRLLHLAGANALSSETQRCLANGFPREGMIIRELVEVERLLQLLTVKAIDLRELDEPENQLIEGLPISYHHLCRTKNGASRDPNDVRNYSFEKSPLIYLDSHGYRYIQPYDPIWLTTNTAHGRTREGSVKLAGIAIIKAIDHTKKQVIASPLAFGIPNLFF
jgi:hypothetical protein